MAGKPTAARMKADQPPTGPRYAARRGVSTWAKVTSPVLPACFARVKVRKHADVVVGHGDPRHERPLRHVAAHASGARVDRADHLPGGRALVRGVAGETGTFVDGGACLHVPVRLVAGDAGEPV